jgi:hypothetical protein
LSPKLDLVLESQLLSPERAPAYLRPTSSSYIPLESLKGANSPHVYCLDESQAAQIRIAWLGPGYRSYPSLRHRHRRLALHVRVSATGTRRLALHGRVTATGARRLRSGHCPSTHLISLALVLGLLDRATHSRSRARFIEPRNARRYKCKASRGYCYLQKQPRPAAALTALSGEVGDAWVGYLADVRMGLEVCVNFGSS